MTSATIKLFLPRGDAKSLRTAEISNWTGKAIAAPRTELDDLMAREELDMAGVYILLGSAPQTNAPHAYIGEASQLTRQAEPHCKALGSFENQRDCRFCHVGVYANWAPQLDIIYVHLGFIYYFLDISRQMSRV
jgi:hypothetical protein